MLLWRGAHLRSGSVLSCSWQNLVTEVSPIPFLSRTFSICASVCFSLLCASLPALVKERDLSWDMPLRVEATFPSSLDEAGPDIATGQGGDGRVSLSLPPGLRCLIHSSCPSHLLECRPSGQQEHPRGMGPSKTGVACTLTPGATAACAAYAHTCPFVKHLDHGFPTNPCFN